MGQTPLLTLDDPNPQAGAFFGSSVVRVGDVNGDTVLDLAVGASGQDVGANRDQGQAFVFSGATGALLLTLDNPNPQAFAFFGDSLAGVGDVNGDTVPDLAVGAPFQNVGPNPRQGQAFIFSGATGTLLFTLDDPTPQVSFSSDEFGRSLAGVGDVDGDGVPDLAVGARRKEVGANFDQGQAFVFSGATGTLLLILDNPNPQADAFFGGSLALLGDVDGDSVPDLAVGASFQDVGGNVNQGQAFVFSGATGALLLTLDDPTRPHRSSHFGVPLTVVGDVNGDTVPDLAVGAFFKRDVGPSQGQAFVFSGATGALLLILDDPNPQAFAFFGFSVAGVGDVNGDTVPDLAVGAVRQDVGPNDDQGQVFVFSGATGTLLLTLNDPNPQVFAFFGKVAGIGDVNGDTVPDLAVGAFRQDVGANRAQGQAFVFSLGTLPVPIDIKPLSCPNKLNVRSRGVIPVAILGTGDIDVTTIDRNSIKLSGAAALRSSFEDEATPFTPFVGKESESDCTDEGQDGFLDLTLKFDSQEVIQALEITFGRELGNGEVVVLHLTGNLKEEFFGTPIRGEDVLVIKK